MKVDKVVCVWMFCFTIFFSIPAASSASVVISEYVEGSSHNKAIELFNASDLAIDLLKDGYGIEIYFNGNTVAKTRIELNGTIPPKATYVIAHHRATAEILSIANQTSNKPFFNGDDAIVLLKEGVVKDSIGQIGMDPGSEWGSGVLSTRDNTLRRLSHVTVGDKNPYDATDLSSWSGFSVNTFDGLGEHLNENPSSYLFIHEIQGAGDKSPLVGSVVTTKGIVTAEYQGSDRLNGFFLQTEDLDADKNPDTSEGIFVKDSTPVSIGDFVMVTGRVEEHYGMTQLASVSSIEIISGNHSLPLSEEILLPMPNPESEPFYMESREGMHVRFFQALTVSENYNLGRYGELLLSKGRLMNPTHVAKPGIPALDVKEKNALNRIIMDDASTRQNPDPIIFPAPELTAERTVRSGFEVTGVTGVLGYAYGAYRVFPTTDPSFELKGNPRLDTPSPVGGRIKVASFNVLNYFNGDGKGGGFPTSRGADTLLEFTRQQDKIVSAIRSLDADVLGLMEIENDGYGPFSAIADLVNALNDCSQNCVTYDFVDPGTPRLGSDQIAVGIIYNTMRVKPVGVPASIESGAFSNKNRQPLARSFEELATGEVFTVVVNHFKSKGSPCDSVGDPDKGDGQGNCNLTRTAAAKELIQWLDTQPTEIADKDLLIIGDLNAYAMEDPISAIKNKGYTDLIHHYKGNSGYSYVYKGEAGYLDHALASHSMALQVKGVTEWHINADEPRVLDYNTEYKSSNQITQLYSPGPFRASDHDPVLIGLDLGTAF